jgi:hypothetical protein
MPGPILGFITSVLGVIATAQAQRPRTTTTRTTTTRTTSTRTTSAARTTTTVRPVTTTTVSVASSSSSTSSATASPSVNAAIFTGNVDSTVLVIARDAYGAQVASSGLNGYGIPFQILQVPQAGVALPTLNTTAGGNFGGIIVAEQVSYDYGNGNFSSALTAGQWQQMYDYQTMYGVRMVQYGVYPGPLYGATALGGCCDASTEQLFSFSNVAAFPQAGIKTGAGVSTAGLYHYPATITDTTTTTEIAQFAAAGGFQVSTAGVINNFAGRQQMVFFLPQATDWNPTSNFVQHAYITWMTRGLYTGFRRVNLNTQIDDMMLATDIYNGLNQPTSPAYRVNSNDMTNVANWVSTITAKMNAGSFYLPEIGYNGNGAIDAATQGGEVLTDCGTGPVYTEERADTALEFQKPLGSGTNAWPSTPTTYTYTTTCNRKDALWVWFNNANNRDKFMHLSHTYTHYELNNATYSDALKEIQFNQAWLQQIGLTGGRFSANSLIPPAITGLHNGDVLRAWKDAGLTNCVGDNTRPLLRNSQNPMWPYKTTVAADGYDGFNVIPRWATRIYYNCDTADCTTREWIETSAGVGDFTALLDQERKDTMRHLFGLYHEG